MVLLWDEGVSLSPGTQAEVFRFLAAAGQHLYFDGRGANSQANWNCVGPANESLGFANIVNDFELTIPRDGEYVLVLSGFNAAPVPYSVRVSQFSFASAPLSLGQPVFGRLDKPGEQDSYTFNGV